MKTLGILNITTDSFSDGGKYLAPEAALAHAQRLADEGADIIDIGAASSHPDAQAVGPDTEIARLAALVAALRTRGVPLSIDSFHTPVQRWALAAGNCPQRCWPSLPRSACSPACSPGLPQA